jgi:hypothetical protein
MCGICGHPAAVLTRSRAEAMPLSRRLLQAPLYPFSGSGLLSMVALGLFMFLVGKVVGFLAIAAFWAYVFFLIRNSAEGAHRLGVPDFRNVIDDLVNPAVRGILGTVLVWVPAIVYLVKGSGLSFEEALSFEALKDPWLLAMLAFGMIYAPMALMAAATEMGVLDMLNPLLIFTYIKRVGWDYFIAVFALCLVTPVDILVMFLTAPLHDAIPIPVLGGWLATTLNLYPSIVMAHILGLVLHVHGYALDWGDRDKYEEPVLAGMVPRGSIPAQAAAAPIVIGDNAGPPLLDIPFPLAPLDTNDGSTQYTPGFQGPAAPVLEALLRRDFTLAMKLFAQSPHDLEPHLPPEEAFVLGALFAKERQATLAFSALKRVAWTNHTVAPRALFVLGRIYAEFRNDLDAAENAYRTILRKFPGSPEAESARSHLRKLGYQA